MSSLVITEGDIRAIVLALGQQAADDIAWSEGITEPQDADVFAGEAIYVICNSGMKNSVATGIFNRCMPALKAGTPVRDVFGHPGKAAAIERIWRERDELLAAYQASSDKLAFCESLPWIGGITKYHLAKNFGVNCPKPDVHMQRLADLEGVTVLALCQRLATATGYRVATIDTLLWRACANGVINSRTGSIHASEHLGNQVGDARCKAKGER